MKSCISFATIKLAGISQGESIMIRCCEPAMLVERKRMKSNCGHCSSSIAIDCTISVGRSIRRASLHEQINHCVVALAHHQEWEGEVIPDRPE